MSSFARGLLLEVQLELNDVGAGQVIGSLVAALTTDADSDEGTEPMGADAFAEAVATREVLVEAMVARAESSGSSHIARELQLISSVTATARFAVEKPVWLCTGLLRVVCEPSPSS